MPKLSKHKKKSWRKQIDLNEFDEYFEDQRLDERVGKRAYEFIVQTQGTNNEAQIVNPELKKPARNFKKTSEIVKNLHCYKPLNVTTKVPALDDNRNQPKWKVKLPKLKQVSKVVDEISTYYDIWDVPKVKKDGDVPKVKKDEEVPKVKKDEDVPKVEKVEYVPKVKTYKDVPKVKKDDEDEIRDLRKLQNVLIGKQPVKVLRHLYQKPTLRSSVEMPMPGLSYNPTAYDHQQLIKAAVVVEEAKLRQEQKLANQVTKNFVKKSEIDPNAWMKEMSQGLGSDEDDGQAEEEQDSNESVPSKKPVTCKRKTKAQRAREKKNKMLQQKSKAKVAPQQIGLKKVLKELREKEAKIEEKMKMKDEKRIEKLKTGNESKVDEDIVVSMSNELKGSLRKVTVAGNLLEERFKSLQKRGIIEAKGRKSDDKKKKIRRMRKTKLFVKRNHRPTE